MLSYQQFLFLFANKTAFLDATINFVLRSIISLFHYFTSFTFILCYSVGSLFLNPKVLLTQFLGASNGDLVGTNDVTGAAVGNLVGANDVTGAAVSDFVGANVITGAAVGVKITIGSGRRQMA